MEEGSSKGCMNAACRASASPGQWKKGWVLRSGGFANLCYTCGMAYEKLLFCDLFHAKETGWRECNSCGKHLHCGCIASKFSMELLDDGGVQCIGCMKNTELPSIPYEILQDSSTEEKNCFDPSAKEKPHNLTTGRISGDMNNKTIIQDSTISMSNINFNNRGSLNGSFGPIKKQHIMLSVGDQGNTGLLCTNKPLQGFCQDSRWDDDNNGKLTDKRISMSPQASLDISLGIPPESCNGSTNSHVTIIKDVADDRENNKPMSTFEQVQRPQCLLPRPSRICPGSLTESPRNIFPEMRVARPPGEGRGRGQLLPRYWPRITDQELQQISGDSNSTIVPLFEKILSASDAGRIGRLVLPKACAEAYFPPISQPEGLPIKIQDSKGKDWIFQFRFWPNNNSRMYVLEGVTPCIQSLQLQAGDTVTFSRIDPIGKLVMGFRKATNSVSLQDLQISATASGRHCTENFLSGVIENLHVASSYPDLLKSLKGNREACLGFFCDADANVSWQSADKHWENSLNASQLQSSLIQERKKGRTIGSKSKRLHIDNEDALELKLTWEEAQDLLRPPPSTKPSIVVIEEQEFEEYEEPPVFGKRTIFTARASGGHDQWAHCDSCSKWRKLPVDAVLPSRWVCQDNIWDSQRSSCSVPDEMSFKELQSLIQQNTDFRRQKLAAVHKPPLPEREASGLDALATAAALCDDASPSTSSVAVTTRHPRHRPGCTCIVCIQPPSGKGPKHKPTCTCNVCMTVKRRFKTLMMRKKKRQSEIEEAKSNNKLEFAKKDEAESDACIRNASNEMEPRDDPVLAELIKGKIDLNFHPEREESKTAKTLGSSHVSMMGDASLPLENYLNQTGPTSLMCEQLSSSFDAPVQVPGENGGKAFPPVQRENTYGIGDAPGMSDQIQSNLM